MSRHAANWRRNLSTAAALLALAGVGGACDSATTGKPTAKAAAPQATTARDSSGATTYALATAESKVGFVGAKVTGDHEGGFKVFTGNAKISGTPENGSVEVEIDMGSVFSDHEKLTGHLRAPDFFDVATHPKARFVSTSVKAGGTGGTHTVTGNLTLRGVTKSIAFPATIGVANGKVTAKAEFSINRHDFGVAYAGMADDLIKDQVLLKLDLTFESRTSS
jgi:polyisoprenoid-binding protein YceI